MPIPAKSVLSLEYVRVKVMATEDGAPVNPTSDTVQMAFPLIEIDPTVPDWQTAEWEIAGNTYFARCLVGPTGTIDLPVGLYDVWVKVVTTPESPVMRSGRLGVT
jgi:hypothetical protein